MLRQRVREYATAKGLHRQTLDRWLAWGEVDGEALLGLALELRAGENHLRDLMDWLEEIALRDGVTIREVLSGESIARIASEPRLGRGDKLKRIKEEVRRRRFPRLSRIEDDINRRIHDLKLSPEIKIASPPGLEGGALGVKLKASSQEELKLLVRELAEAAEKNSVREIFDILAGQAVAEGREKTIDPDE